MTNWLLKSALGALLALSLRVPAVVTAQSDASFQFYHGSGKTSRISVDNNNDEIKNNGRKFEVVLNPGVEVCITIINAHPTNYKYSLEAVVDTTQPQLPDLSVI